MPSTDRVELGRAGEDAALAEYEARGFHLVARNWRCAIGELDLVLHRRGLLVFCEVKTRRGFAFGGGYEGVHGKKREKIRRLAQAFLISERPPHVDVRFDVVSAYVHRDHMRVDLFEDAF